MPNSGCTWMKCTDYRKGVCHYEGTECKYREAESDNAMMEMILDAIQNVLDGKEVSDFELSFPIVREVADLKHFQVVSYEN